MISVNDQRALTYNSGTTTWLDISKEVSNQHAGSLTLTLSPTQYLYLGSYLPFNHKYFLVSAVNAVLTSLTVEVYNGTQWVSVNEIFDYTDVSGAPFGQSGILQFTTDRDETWTFVGDTSEDSYLTEFTNYSSPIYEKYWLRISAGTSISLDLDYIGSLFVDEDELISEYPILNSSRILTAWESGKTTWLDQRIIASEYVITELKKRNIIIERSQVVERSVLLQAALYRTAEIIFSGLGGKNYGEEIKLARERFSDAMNLNKFEQDVSGDGQKGRSEQIVTTHRMSR